MTLAPCLLYKQVGSNGMILMKRFSSKEVLELLAELMKETIPEDMEGNLHLNYDDEDGVEVFFVEDSEEAVEA